MSFGNAIKPLGAWCAIAAIPMLLCVDTAVAYTRGWRPESTPVWIFVSFAAFIAAAITLSLGLPSVRTLLRVRFRDVVAVMLSQALLILGVEYMSGVLADRAEVEELPKAIANDPRAAEPGTVTKFHHHAPNIDRVGTGFLPESRFKTNSLGIRGSELPIDRSITRILCIGSSTTEMSYADQNDTWYQLAMDRLNEPSDANRYWFGGLGKSGFTTRNHIAYIRQSDLFEEADIAIFLVGAVDTLRSLSKLSISQAKPPVLLQTNTARLFTYNLPLRMGLNQDVADMSLSARMKRRMNAPKLHSLTMDPDNARKFAARIRQTIEASRAKGVTPLFMTQPTLWSDSPNDPNEDRYWTGETANGIFIATPLLKSRADAYNDITIDTCRDMGVACIDLSSMNENRDYFFDDCHFSLLGSKEVARILAEWFRDHNP